LKQFLPALNRKLPGLEVRLPTEAEWEYACRAGTPTPFFWPEPITPEQLNYDGNYPYNGAPKGLYRNRTVPVKEFLPNTWGLYQMHGNVWEWCQDVKADYPTAEVVDPTGPQDGVEGRQRVLRGGGWGDDGGYCRSASRSANGPGVRIDCIGFRLARGDD
jgi:formylglycine-generating enzyme required for sulfatase activity